jgi:hypothetical protein
MTEVLGLQQTYESKRQRGQVKESNPYLTGNSFLITCQFCSDWKQAITLTAIPFSCLNTRNLVSAAAFHTIVLLPVLLGSFGRSTTAPKSQQPDGEALARKPSQAYKSGCKPVKVSGNHGGDFTESHGSTGSMKSLDRTRQSEDPATTFFQGSLLVSRLHLF